MYKNIKSIVLDYASNLLNFISPKINKTNKYL